MKATCLLSCPVNKGIGTIQQMDVINVIWQIGMGSFEIDILFYSITQYYVTISCRDKLELDFQLFINLHCDRVGVLAKLAKFSEKEEI